MFTQHITLRYLAYTKRLIEMIFLMFYQRSIERRTIKSMNKEFYTSSLVTELHPVIQGNLSLNFHYIKSFTQSSQDYIFYNQTSHQDS